MRRDRAGLLDRLAVLERRPRTPPVRLALAEAEFRLAIAPGTDPDEAVERLRRALTHDPFAAKAHLHLGRILHRNGRRWASLAAYREAHRAAPANPRVPLLMGLALIELDRRERAVGAALLVAATGDNPAAVAAAIAGFDALTSMPDGGGKPAGRKRPAMPEDLPTGAWRALLHEQLAAKKPPTERWVRDYLAGGRDPAEVCTAAVLLLAAGVKLPAELTAGMPAGHPAVRMLTAALDLAGAADDKFPVEAARLVESRLIPAELVCALHHSRFKPDRVDTLTAVRLLDAYPAEMRELACFRELRIAVLDAYARRAWQEERFDEAGVLWRATVPLDPYRVAVAVDLALLATRTRSPAYAAAWERAAELPYLHAAALGDLDHLAGDRVALHRTLAEQSLHSGGDDPAVITGWVADGDAVEVWLRHWDLYYVNARLRFRSPAHLLGVPPDAGPEALAEARDVLLRHLDGSVGAQDWAGTARFGALARARITSAWQQLSDRIGDDPHREREQPAADELLDEARRRVLLLHNLSISLRSATSARHRRLLCAIARHEFLLPLDRLHELCVARQSLDGKVHLAAILELATAEFAAGWDTTAPADPADTRRMLADLEAVIHAAPDRAGPRVPHARLLAWSDRPDDAYAAAAAALAGLAERASGDNGEAARIRRARIGELLVAVVDDVAGASLDGDLAAARRAMTRFPLSVVPAITVALTLPATDVDEAVRLLSDRLRAAESEAQRSQLRSAVRRLRSADAAVREVVRRLHQRATDAAHRSRSAAIADLDHAVTLARARGLGRETGRLRADLARLRDLQER